MRQIAAIVMALALPACAEFWEDLEKGQPYEGKGVSFQHSYAWGVWNTDEEDTAAHKVVYASHGDAHVVIDLFDPKLTEHPPAQERAQQFTVRALEDLKTWRWSDPSFAEQSSEPVKRTVAGATRSGERQTVTIELSMDSDPVIVADLFWFDTDTRTVAVAAGGRPEKIAEQREEIEQILTTLKIE